MSDSSIIPTDLSIFCKNQLRDDTWGLPGRGLFFEFLTCPFSKKHVYLGFWGQKHENWDAEKLEVSLLGSVGPVLKS